MARPKKTNADYFTHDTDMRNDLRIKAIRRKFGLAGYAVWNMLLEVISDSDNLELEYNDDQIELISADFDIDTSELRQIINYCIQLKVLVSDNEILTSETLKKRLLPLFLKRERQLSTAITPNLRVIDSENTHSKVKESKVNKSKEKESKENIEHGELDVFLDSDIHFSILEYFGFTEMRNPDKLQQISIFLNILNTDRKIEMFSEQFEAYKTFKEKSNTARHSFPNFLGSIDERFLDGAWNQENWTAKLETITKQRTDEHSPFTSSSVDKLRAKILAGEC